MLKARNKAFTVWFCFKYIFEIRRLQPVSYISTENTVNTVSINRGAIHYCK